MRWVTAGIVITFMVTGCSDRESPAPAVSSKTQSSWEPSSLGQVSDASPGFDSPQAAFDAVKAAAVHNDVVGAIRCMSSRSQKKMAEIMMLPLTMIAAFDPKKEQEVTALLSDLVIDGDSALKTLLRNQSKSSRQKNLQQHGR